MLRNIMREIRVDMIKTTYFTVYMIAASLNAISKLIMSCFFDGEPLN